MAAGGEEMGRGSTARPSAAFEIRVLGPLEVRWGGQRVDVGGLKSRSLIARLLIDRKLVVSVDRLLDSLWNDHPGEGAEIALRSTISRLRKRLRDAGANDDLIVTRAPGYMLDAEAETTDVHRFEMMVADGRRQLARRRPMASMRLLREAADMWRGAAYSEVRDELLCSSRGARWLEELLLTATEIRLDAELTMGRHAAIVGELGEGLTNENPMRERLWSQRMLALYRSGRQAESLRVYQQLRSILIDELGIEPGHDITWMEEAILNQNPALDIASPEDLSQVEPSEEGWNDAVVTAPLTYHPQSPAPADEGRLVGRDDELGRLLEWWRTGGARSSSAADGRGRRRHSGARAW